MERRWPLPGPGLDRAVDTTIAVAVAVLTVVNLHFPEPSTAYTYPEPNALQVGLAIVGSLMLALRRTHPALSFFVMLAISGGISAMGWSAGLLPYALAFAMYSIAAHAAFPWALAGLIANYVQDAVLFALKVPYFEDAYVLITVAWFTALWIAGIVMRSVRRARERSHAQALEAERSKTLAAAEARASERLRIARDMHDIVAHTMSVVSVQAGLARRLVGRDPDGAVAAMTRVETAARTATDDLRRMLGVLRADDNDAELRPAPGVEELTELVGEGRLELSGNPASLPDSLRLTVFRIVQESLTNARKHAPQAPVTVRVAEQDGRVEIEVTNGPHPSVSGDVGTGWGLVGLQERVEAYGGVIRAAPSPEGGFTVRAAL